MGNGYRVPPADRFDELAQRQAESAARLSEVERPSGSQVFAALAKVKQMVLDLPALVASTATAFLSSGFTTGSMTATGSISSGADVSVGGALTVPGAYNNNLTGVGGFRTAYWGIGGQAGYVPSSRQFKQDIEDAAVDVDAVLQMRAVRYRYKDAVANFGDEAQPDVGVIAEEVEELGLTWLVEYDATGAPLGFKYDRLAIALLDVVQSLDARLRKLEG